MKRATVLGLLVAIGALSLLALQAPQQLEIQKVKENLYMITGNGGNTGIFITDRGVVIVDTKIPGTGQAILEKIKGVTNKPVTMIINTHAHADHTGSNEFFD